MGISGSVTEAATAAGLGDGGHHGPHRMGPGHHLQLGQQRSHRLGVDAVPAGLAPHRADRGQLGPIDPADRENLLRA